MRNHALYIQLIVLTVILISTSNNVYLSYFSIIYTKDIQINQYLSKKKSNPVTETTGINNSVALH